MAEQTHQQRPARPAGKQPAKPAAGPKTRALAQLATALNAAPPVQRLEEPRRQLAQRAANRTGLPDNVKSGVEALSGMSMDHVRVHYNSPRPAQLNAHAYAQGSDIHVAPGQQRHVPHEAWHVVQQAQGRVRATAQLKGGVPINDDKALESEADRVGSLVAQPMSRLRTTGGERAPRVPAAPVGQRQVVQAVRSLATFQAQTPKTLLSPRKQIVQIDAALDEYIHAGSDKRAKGDALVTTIDEYIDAGGHAASRVRIVQQLLAEVQAELPLVAALGAFAGLTDELIRSAGGAGSLAELTALATTIGAANAGVLPQLVAAAKPDLATLDTLIQHIGRPNAHLLVALIPAGGGAAHLPALDSVVQHATSAHALQLYALIPTGFLAGLPALDALIIAAGSAHVPLLPQMVIDAGGHAAVPDLTAAIALHHAGHGDLATDLTKHSAGSLARFQRLAALIPNFAQDHPAPAPGGIAAAVTAYNRPGYRLVDGGPEEPGIKIPLAARIGQVEWAHFLQRHTMHYFDFTGIIAQNDQWPFVGVGAAAQLGNLVITGINALTANSAAGGWWLAPNTPKQVAVGGGFEAQMGTKAGGPPLAKPPGLGGGSVASAIFGQFYPIQMNGVIVLDRADMTAIRPLV